MNGLEHYKEAEGLLAVWQTIDMDSPEASQCIARAQVHATLALAWGLQMSIPGMPRLAREATARLSRDLGMRRA